MQEPQGSETEANAEVESQPAPTEPTKAKTKTELFAEKIESYPDIDTARLHYKTIAEQLGVAKSLGYKAEKLTKFVREAEKIPKPAVATVRISEAEPMEIPKEEGQPQPTPQPQEPQLVEEPQPAELITPTAPPTPTGITPTMEKLQPILERSIERLFNNAIETIAGAKEMLTGQEAKDTATLLPIMIWRITRVSLTEDQFIDMTCVTHFGSIVLKVVSKKVTEWRTKREAEAMKPKPTPKPEPPKQEEKPTETPNPTPPQEPPKEKPKDASFLHQLS